MGSDSIDFVYPNKLLIHSINWGLTPIIVAIHSLHRRNRIPSTVLDFFASAINSPSVANGFEIRVA